MGDSVCLYEDERRRRFFRVYDDKNNRAPPSDSSDWYQMISVDLGNGAIAPNKSGGRHSEVRQRALKNCLHIGTSANIAVAYDEYFPRASGLRQATPHGDVAATMKDTIGQISRRVIRPLEELTRSEFPAGNRSHDNAVRAFSSRRCPSSHSPSEARSPSFTRECVGTVKSLSRRNSAPFPARSPGRSDDRSCECCSRVNG